MKDISAMAIIDVQLPRDLDEFGMRLDLAIENGDICTATDLVDQLKADGGTIDQSTALAIGGLAVEQCLPYVVLDMCHIVSDYRVRIAWLLECLEMGVTQTLEGVNVAALLQEELDDSPDGEFVHASMMFLERIGRLDMRAEVLTDSCDPDLIGLSIVPDLSYA